MKRYILLLAMISPVSAHDYCFDLCDPVPATGGCANWPTWQLSHAGATNVPGLHGESPGAAGTSEGREVPRCRDPSGKATVASQRH